MDTYPSADAAFARLHAAGWSVGEVLLLTAEGPRWQICGSNGENLVNARGRTQAEGSWLACQQAGAAGMLRARRLHGREWGR